jgi:hypothetical protein
MGGQEQAEDAMCHVRGARGAVDPEVQEAGQAAWRVRKTRKGVFKEVALRWVSNAFHQSDPDPLLTPRSGLVGTGAHW